MDFEIDLLMFDEIEFTLCQMCKNYHECQKGVVCNTLKKFIKECD